MADTTIQVIHGSDLRGYLRKIDKELSARIDPSGVNIVNMSFIHGDQNPFIRAFMMLKLQGSDEPHEVTIEFPIGTFNDLTQMMPVEGHTH